MWQQRGRPTLQVFKVLWKTFLMLVRLDNEKNSGFFFSPPNSRVNKHLKQIRSTAIKWDKNNITITRAGRLWNATTSDNKLFPKMIRAMFLDSAFILCKPCSCT